MSELFQNLLVIKLLVYFSEAGRFSRDLILKFTP